MPPIKKPLFGKKPEKKKFQTSKELREHNEAVLKRRRENLKKEREAFFKGEKTAPKTLKEKLISSIKGKKPVALSRKEVKKNVAKTNKEKIIDFIKANSKKKDLLKILLAKGINSRILKARQINIYELKHAIKKLKPIHLEKLGYTKTELIDLAKHSTGIGSSVLTFTLKEYKESKFTGKDFAKSKLQFYPEDVLKFRDAGFSLKDIFDSKKFRDSGGIEHILTSFRHSEIKKLITENPKYKSELNHVAGTVLVPDRYDYISKAYRYLGFSARELNKMGYKYYDIVHRGNFTVSELRKEKFSVGDIRLMFSSYSYPFFSIESFIYGGFSRNEIIKGYGKEYIPAINKAFKELKKNK